MTYYVRCVEPYQHPGEGWDEWRGVGPPGSEPKDGVFDVDDGVKVVRVSAKDFGLAWLLASKDGRAAVSSAMGLPCDTGPLDRPDRRRHAVNLLLTGRVLEWFKRDIFTIRESLHAEPTGLWSYPITGVDRPLWYRLPHPLHPLETIAAMRGMGGIETEDPGVNYGPLGRSAIMRSSGWLSLTTSIAQYLFVTPQTVRLVWHLLTPRDVPPIDPLALFTVHASLWEAAGKTMQNSIASGPYRPNFWTEELKGDIEL